MFENFDFENDGDGEVEGHHWLTYVFFLVVIPLAVFMYLSVRPEIKDGM